MATLDSTPAIPPALLGQQASQPAVEITSLLSTGQQIETLLAVISQQLPGLQPAAAQFIGAMRSAMMATASGGIPPSRSGGSVPPGMGM